MLTNARVYRCALRTLATVASGLAAAAAASAAAGPTPAAAATLHSHVFASARLITHPTPQGRAAISQPDDITYLAGRIYVGFQNGVGPQGQASPTGNHDSTVVEFGLNGRRVRQWDLTGKCDGLTADPARGRVIATINEDAHSSLYLVDPAGRATHLRYSAPLRSNGGTDAITIYHGLVLISASAPGTTGAAAPQPYYPAVYRAEFHLARHLVTLRPLFSDEAAAIVANAGSDRGHRVRLALTDPDSNEAVPTFARRFAGDFMLTSQGDMEQIFVGRAATARQSLSVLKLSNSVDDTAWPSASDGTLYTTDNGNGRIYRITGRFRTGSELVAATPCDANDAPSTCPGPGFPPNYLGEVNPATGSIARLALSGPAVQPQGMLFLR